MREGATPARVTPSAVTITVRWGASVLMAKRVSPPKSMALTGGIGKLELGPTGLVLVAGRDRLPVPPGKRVRAVVDDVEIVVDATEDKIAAWAVAPVVERRYAAADLGSLALHLGIAAAGFVWHAPLAHAETDLGSLRGQLAGSEVAHQRVLVGDAPLEIAGASAPAGAAGEGTSARAALGRPASAEGGARHQARRGEQATLDRDAMLEQASRFGMVGLLGEDPSLEASPWGDAAFSSDGVLSGAAAGFPMGSDEGLGGLALSGVGYGGGISGGGVGLGSLGGMTGSPGSERLTVGTIGGTYGMQGHAAKGQSVRWRCACGSGVSGRLPPEIVQRIVRQNFGRFRACYTDSLRGQPGLSERVSVRFVIGRDGSVGSAVATSDTGQTSLAQCVTRAFYGLSFPQPEGGVVTVTYPIVFSPVDE